MNLSISNHNLSPKLSARSGIPQQKLQQARYALIRLRIRVAVLAALSRIPDRIPDVYSLHDSLEQLFQSRLKSWADRKAGADEESQVGVEAGAGDLFLGVDASGGRVLWREQKQGYGLGLDGCCYVGSRYWGLELGRLPAVVEVVAFPGVEEGAELVHELVSGGSQAVSIPFILLCSSQLSRGLQWVPTHITYITNVLFCRIEVCSSAFVNPSQTSGNAQRIKVCDTVACCTHSFPFILPKLIIFSTGVVLCSGYSGFGSKGPIITARL